MTPAEDAADGGDGSPPFVACYGGTFDPVHIGHVEAVRDLLARSVCDELRVIPAAAPPHRPRPGATPEQRLHMLELAFADIGGVRVDPIELMREGPSYTVDTLTHMRRVLGPRAALGWVLGTDALAGLTDWHRWRELPELAHLLVLERPGHPLPDAGVLGELVAERRVAAPTALRQAPSGLLWCVGQRPMAVSATQVRDRLAQVAREGSCQRPDGLLSPAVWAYICEAGLYDMQCDMP